MPITPPQPLAPAQPNPNKKRNKNFRVQADACKQFKRKLIQNWTISVDFRRGKPFGSQSDEDRVAVNLDWSLTKMKQAALFSQVPAVRVNHPPQTTSKEASTWVHAFEQKINDELLKAGIETAMDECLPDCINAAGIGVVMVSHEALTEDVEVPAIDFSTMPPQIQMQILQSGFMPDGSPIPMESVPRVIDHRYVVSRISPADFLWPISFTGSDFDNAPWVGRTGRITWAEAQQRFKLDEADKAKYVSNGERNLQDTISNDADREQHQGDEWVSFDEIFYKTYRYDPAAKSYFTINHVIFLNGKDEPVLDEPWKGQQPDPENGELVGAFKFPIRVLSLSYITDEAIPPSDSAIGRSQVNEINKSRTQMILQREHSLPIRTFDVNRLDPAIQQALMRGVWQHMIPVQGNGQNVISEISRSAFPNENFTFDKIAKMDLSEMWQVGQGDSGVDIETAGEANAVRDNSQTRIARERAKVGKFFCSIAEVLGGLIAIFEDGASFGEGFTAQVSKTLNYSILADSTVLLDSNQRLQRLMQFINFTAKSGWVNLEPVLREIATLSGLDPAVVIQPPQPSKPAEPSISLRLTGTEDMLNPLTLGFLIKAGQAPDAKTIEQAKALINVAVTPPPPPVPVGQPGPGMVGPQGQLAPPMTPAPLPGAEQLGPQEALPEPAPPNVGDANSQWSAMSRINQRVVDRGQD